MNSRIEQATRAASGYQRGWRRMLVDMEIPGWDERFLAEFEPERMADLYARAGVSSVMFSCKNLSGLCLWPTTVGEEHPGTRGRDVVAETVRALDARGIAACAYFSAVYDNWAFEHDADWRFAPIGGWRREGTEHDRHGLCCLNSPGYRTYQADQILDLYGRYDVECAFCDMSFWPGVCGCRHCRDRYREESGRELPQVVDWTSQEWCAFQAARERWVVDFQALVTDAMRRARPGISVYHNFAVGPAHWTRGVPFRITEQSDFLGGDLYGDAIEQLAVTKLMRGLSQTQPVEYMTFAALSYDEHVRLKSPERMRAQVLAACAESAAFMFIDGIDPEGTANPGLYDGVGTAFAASAAFEPQLGGEAVEDVGIYFSDDSKLDFSENGRAVQDVEGSYAGGYPHMQALLGACRALQRAHIPFGVITRRDLGALDRFAAVVLPNVARMDAAEVEAIRAYVDRGGRVYASGATSLVETRGVLHDDFMLADVFGTHLVAEDEARVAYAEPIVETLRSWLAPQRTVAGTCGVGTPRGGLLRLRADAGAEVLARLLLPYGHPHLGDVTDRHWASIHSSPPWEDTGEPAIVQHRFGAGRAVYSTLDVEREDVYAEERCFAALIADLVGDGWSLRCDTAPGVAVSAFREDEQDAIRVALLNAPAALVPAAVLRLRPPSGTEFVAVEQLPSGASLPFETGADGVLTCTVRDLPELTMLRVRHQPIG